jgi:hypothetical protein
MGSDLSTRGIGVTSEGFMAVRGLLVRVQVHDGLGPSPMKMGPNGRDPISDLSWGGLIFWGSYGSCYGP